MENICEYHKNHIFSEVNYKLCYYYSAIVVIDLKYGLNMKDIILVNYE